MAEAFDHVIGTADNAGLEIQGAELAEQAFERLADAMAEQVKGTSIEIVNITPQLLRGRLANAGPACNRIRFLANADAKTMVGGKFEGGSRLRSG